MPASPGTAPAGPDPSSPMEARHDGRVADFDPGTVSGHAREANRG